MSITFLLKMMQPSLLSVVRRKKITTIAEKIIKGGMPLDL